MQRVKVPKKSEWVVSTATQHKEEKSSGFFVVPKANSVLTYKRARFYMNGLCIGDMASKENLLQQLAAAVVSPQCTGAKWARHVKTVDQMSCEVPPHLRADVAFSKFLLIYSYISEKIFGHIRNTFINALAEFHCYICKKFFSNVYVALNLVRRVEN